MLKEFCRQETGSRKLCHFSKNVKMTEKYGIIHIRLILRIPR